MPTMTSHHADLYYEVHGEGHPVIFTHGASWNHKQWEPQVQFFAERYKTIVWDVRGHGYSSLPEGKVDSETFSKDLIALMDHLEIKRAVLCGLSMGGHISLQTAIRFPERVEALVLIGTPFTNAFNWFEKCFVPFNRWSSRMIPMRLTGRIQAAMLSKYNPDNRAYIEEAFNMLTQERWLRLWDAITRMESREHLDHVQCPVLLLQGEHDTMIKRQQKYMHSKIRNSELHIIPRAHHATNLDNPNAVNEQISRFLVKHRNEF